MALVKFNKDFTNKDNDEIVHAQQVIEMTLKRADEVVENIKGKHKGYEQFGYERVEEGK